MDHRSHSDGQAPGRASRRDCIKSPEILLKGASRTFCGHRAVHHVCICLIFPDAGASAWKAHTSLRGANRREKKTDFGAPLSRNPFIPETQVQVPMLKDGGVIAREFRS